MNFFRYGVQAAATNLLYWTTAILQKNGGPVQYDVVHCHFGHRGNIGVFLRDAGVLDGKIVTSFYGRDVSEFPETFGDGFYDFLFENGDLFLALSDHMKKRLIELGAPEEKVIVQPLAIDPERFRPSPEAGSDESMTILSVGRLVQKKGFIDALKTIDRLKDRPDLPSFEYLIAGDGRLREEFERMIDRRDLDNVRLLGWRTRDEIRDLYDRADLFLAPSVTSAAGDKEGTPTVIYEAMSMALPVVATRHAGIPEQVVDGETGFLVDERDVEDLRKKISTLLYQKSLCEEMGKKGRQRIREKFDIRRVVKRLRTIYSAVQDGEKLSRIPEFRF